MAYLRLGNFKYAIADFEQSAYFYQKEGKSIDEQEVRLRLRQAEAEKLRQAEAERLRQAEAEKQKKIYRNWGIGIFGLFCLGSIIGGLSNTPEQTQISSPSSMLSANSKHSFPQTSCGNRSNNPDEIWYPVFVDGGNLDSIRSKLCRDAFSTFRRKTGKPTVQVASFTNYNRALEFAEAVGGEVGSPTPPTKTNLEN